LTRQQHKELRSTPASVRLIRPRFSRSIANTTPQSAVR
jgi:hypothetical protein